MNDAEEEVVLQWAKLSRQLRDVESLRTSQARPVFERLFGRREAVEQLATCELEASTSIYRARKLDRDDPSTVMGDPAMELSAPPPEKSPGGRMNFAGEPVFYGAGSVDTAVSEIRPAVGDWVAVGEFRASRRVKMLDLTQIHRATTADAGRRRMFGTIHDRLTVPTDRVACSCTPRGRSSFDPYLMTQLVAAYLKNELGLDGVQFASSQAGGLPITGECPVEGMNFAQFDRRAPFRGRLRTGVEHREEPV